MAGKLLKINLLPLMVEVSCAGRKSAGGCI